MNRSGLFMLAGLAVAAASAVSLADGVVVISNPVGWRAASFSGGAFQVTASSGYIGEGGGPNGSFAPNSFLSFCLERNEDVSLPGTYNATISDSAQGGGLGGQNANGVDPLSTATATIYQAFRSFNVFTGALGTALVDGLINTASETRSLQRAIWFLEDELTNFQGDTLAQDLKDWAIANDTGSLGLVRVLRLTSVNGDLPRQDQLTIVPLPPAAWAGIGSLAGVAAIGYVRRRKQLS